jgi:hypothetical protein
MTKVGLLDARRIGDAYAYAVLYSVDGTTLVDIIKGDLA